jgi:RHS repeat-associated protein
MGTERLRTAYNANGNPTYTVEGTYTSLPWGDAQTTASGSDLDAYHYATLDHDTESDTDHAQFRQYTNTQGHWLSPDPYGGSYDASNPQSFNRYVYAMNSPLGAVDPSGLECVWDDGRYDAANDPETGNAIACVAAGGTWVPPDLFESVEGTSYGDWSDKQSSQIVSDWLTPSVIANSPLDNPITINVPMYVWEWAAQQTTPVHGPWTYGNYAGPNGMGAPIDNADVGAMVHDYCYDHAPGGPYNMWSNFGPPNAALQACNQALCDLESNVAEGINERETANQPVFLPERMEAGAASQMVFYFTNIVRSGNACQ